jgi:hypothetical protein
VMIGVERGNSFRNRASFAQLVYLPPGLRSCSEQGFIVLLGTNFIYRLMFLLHCIPQLLDWQIQRNASEKSGHDCRAGPPRHRFGVLWLNGNANGHSYFLLLPQLLDWFLFFCLAIVLISNFFRTLAGPAFAHRGSGS